MATAARPVPTEIDPRLFLAADRYRRRQNRTEHPSGAFDAKRRGAIRGWYPDESERRECCAGISKPSRRFPYSLMTHCRTAEHIAALDGVAVADLKRVLRQQDPPKRLQPGTYYKAVALVRGVAGQPDRYFSIYAGSRQEYVLGQEYKEVPRQDHKGGFYAYESAAFAEAAVVPITSRYLEQERVVLAMECSGRYCVYGQDDGKEKIAWERVRPIRVVGEPFPSPYANYSW